MASIASRPLILVLVQQLNPTGRFAVLDLCSLKVDHVAAAASEKHHGREKTRLTKGTGQSIKEGTGRIGGPFKVEPNPAYLAERLKIYEQIKAKQAAELAGACRPAVHIGFCSAFA